MKIIKASYIIDCPEPPIDMLKRIERAGRVCYKSEDKITDISYTSMIKSLINSVKFITDRGVSHELVRHRISNFSQESTRYCSYNKDKFGNEVIFIQPDF